MGKPPLLKSEIKKIVFLRRRGYSLPEIALKVGRGKTAVYKYIQGVQVLEKYQQTLRAKQGGSIARSRKQWDEARRKAKHLISSVNDKEKLIILASLYWSEGNKADLSFINSDPFMVRMFVDCLSSVGVAKDDFRVSLRIFSDLSEVTVVNFWLNLLEIPQSQIINVTILDGKKKGKLKYGMCRVRVVKGGRTFKLILSMIDLLKSHVISAAVVQRIEQDTPNV